MHAWLTIYYWLTFAVSLVLLCGMPSKLQGLSNFMGSLILSMFGFLLWPVFVIAWMKGKKRAKR